MGWNHQPDFKNSNNSTMIKQYVMHMINMDIVLNLLTTIWINLAQEQWITMVFKKNTATLQQNSRQEPISSKNSQLFLLLRRCKFLNRINSKQKHHNIKSPPKNWYVQKTCPLTINQHVVLNPPKKTRRNGRLLLPWRQNPAPWRSRFGWIAFNGAQSEQRGRLRVCSFTGEGAMIGRSRTDEGMGIFRRKSTWDFHAELIKENHLNQHLHFGVQNVSFRRCIRDWLGLCGLLGIFVCLYKLG